jgi:tetratricopeptide (TPR) repeat protein
MKTLYELLGALPDDDAESIRAAFRKAAKANHPDSNPGDPDAPRRFRRIVRANAILSDERQRATYDRLLETALQQQGLKPKRGTFSNRARRAALDTITGAAVTVGMFGGGYLLLVPTPKVALVPAPVVEMSTPAQTALILSTGPSDTIERASPRDRPDDTAAPKNPENRNLENKQLENPETPKEATAPSAPPEEAASAASSPSTPPDPDTGDAQYYRKRGISAYRSGDLYLALVDFDLAISLDPGASDAYIDRAIVYHRMGDLNHAFADVSEAKRIDGANQSKTSPAPASVR